MIQGKQTDKLPEEIEADYAEDYYQIELDVIEGIEGRAYGVMDEMHDLEMLIEVTGKTVEEGEEEFKALKETELYEEYGVLTPEILKNWHKKMFRQFTYKSLMMLAHTALEKWGKTLLILLENEQRIIYKGDNRRGIFDVLDAFPSLNSGTRELTDKVRAFNFLRNAIAHQDEYYEENVKNYDAFKKYIASRSDIIIKKLEVKKGKYTHRVQIKQSTVIKDYIALIKEIFKILINEAATLPVKEANS